VVEVAPPYDHAEITALAAATMATNMICLLADVLKKPEAPAD
jgi:agmatinase